MTSSSAAADAVAAPGPGAASTSDMMDLDDNPNFTNDHASDDRNLPTDQKHQASAMEGVESNCSKEPSPGSRLAAKVEPLESNKTGLHPTPHKEDASSPASQPKPASIVASSENSDPNVVNQPVIKSEAPDEVPSTRPKTPINEPSTNQTQAPDEADKSGSGDAPVTPVNRSDHSRPDLSDPQPATAPVAASLGDAAEIVPGMNMGSIADQRDQSQAKTTGSFSWTPQNDMQIPTDDEMRALSVSGLRKGGFSYPQYGATNMPTTVTPQHLSQNYALETSGLPAFDPQGTTTQRNTYLPAAYETFDANGSQVLQSFAKLEFRDATYQMTTYEVVIGRDTEAIKRAKASQMRNAYGAHLQRCGDEPEMIHRRLARSYVSEKGGICGPASASDDDLGPTMFPAPMDVDRRSEGKKSNDREYVKHTPGAAWVDVEALQPSPHTSCFLAIHSPGPDTASKSKAISRKHMKIFYDDLEGVFKAQAIHNNGYFVNEHFQREKPVVLKSGDRLQVRDVDFTFVITGVKPGQTGGENLSKKRIDPGGKEMSFDFSGNRHGHEKDTSEELSSCDEEMLDLEGVEEGLQKKVEQAENKKSKKPAKKASVSPRAKKAKEIPTKTKKANPATKEKKTTPTKARKTTPTKGTTPPKPDLESSSKKTSPKASSETPAVVPAVPVQTKANDDARLALPQAQPVLPELPDLPEGVDPALFPELFQSKRGPGRPPKDGKMSKRLRKEIFKKAKEYRDKEAATYIPHPEESAEPAKRKPGRPRKNPLPEDAEMPPEKRRASEGLPGLSGEEQKKPKEKKTKTARPKSPPLLLNIEDFTEEQLTKPNKNYCQMIDEKLTPAGPAGLQLKQIYKRISETWPYYYFHTETKGWESSVRHNLLGNEAFKKHEDTGNWYRRPEIDIDAGKKTQKRDRTPPMNQSTQQFNQRQHFPLGQHATPHLQNGYLPQHGQYPQGYTVANQQVQQPAQPSQMQYQQHRPPTMAPGGSQNAVQQPQFVQAPATGQPSPAPASSMAHGQPTQPAAQFRPANGAANPQQPIQHTAPGAATSPPQPIAQTPSASEPPMRPQIEPALVAAVNRTRAHLQKGLADAQCPRPDAILWSAIDRALGIARESTGDKDLQQMESIAHKGLSTIIAKTIEKIRPNGPDGTQPYQTLLHPEVSRQIANFRDSAVVMLKRRFTDEEALECTNRAITQTLGFVDRPPVAADRNSHIGDTLRGNLRTLLDKMPSHIRLREHESIGGRSPASRSAATPTPVQASASPAAGAPVNTIPVPPRQGSAAMSPSAPESASRSTLPLPAQPASRIAMSPPIQGPPPPPRQPSAPAPIQRALSAETRVPTFTPQQAQPQPQQQAQTQRPAQFQPSAQGQVPTQAHASAQQQPAPSKPAPAPAVQQAQPRAPAQTQATAAAAASTPQQTQSQPQAQQQAPVQAQPLAPTQAPAPSPASQPAPPVAQARVQAPPAAATAPQQAQSQPQSQTQPARDPSPNKTITAPQAQAQTSTPAQQQAPATTEAPDKAQATLRTPAPAQSPAPKEQEQTAASTPQPAPAAQQ